MGGGFLEREMREKRVNGGGERERERESEVKSEIKVCKGSTFK